MVELSNVVYFTGPAQVGVGLVFRQNMDLRYEGVKYVVFFKIWKIVSFKHDIR